MEMSDSRADLRKARDAYGKAGYKDFSDIATTDT